MHRLLSSISGAVIAMAIGLASSCSAGPLTAHPGNVAPLGRPVVSARPPASFENAKPVSGHPFGSIAGAAGLRLLPDAIHRAYMAAPLTNGKIQSLFASGSHAILLNAQATVYASLSPSHEYEAGRANILLLAPIAVTSDSQETGALFGESSMSLGPFSSSLRVIVTASAPSLFLTDIVVLPTGILSAAPDTVHFDVAGADGTQQTVPVPGTSGPQHVNFLINATAAGDYPYTISTKDSSWVFTSCTVTKVSGQ